jgi:molybdopterin/thiamine biosynthesis adenylyltransferase
MTTEAERTSTIHSVSDPSIWYDTMVDRNTGMISEEEQNLISEVLVVQAGVGGNSGIPITLAQMGFQRFRLADPDVFSLTNFNRQLGANILTLDRNKAAVLAEEIQRINPHAEVEVYSDGVTLDNVEKFLEGADIVIDGIDIEVMKVRRELYNVARKNGQPMFCCPSLGWGVALGVFDPNSSPSFDELFGEVPDDPHSPERMQFNTKFVMQFLSSRPTGIDMELARQRAKERKPPSTAVALRLNAGLVPCAIYSYLFNKGSIPIMPVSLQIDLLGAKIGKTGPKKRWILNKAAGRMLGNEEEG